MSDPFEGIYKIDWENLHHAYGPSMDVPMLLRSLVSTNPEERDQAYWSLYGNIYHQGTRYEATPYAVTYLVRLLKLETTPDKDRLLMLLNACVTGFHSIVSGPIHSSGPPWGAQPCLDTEQEILQKIELEASKAIPTAIEILTHHDPHVRSASAYFLASMKPFTQASELIFRVVERIYKEENPIVRSTLVFALGHLMSLDEGSSEIERIFEEDSDDLVILTSALLLALRNGENTPLAVIRYITEVFSSPDELEQEYQKLPFYSEGLSGDLAYVLKHVGHNALEIVVPDLIKSLESVESFDAVGLIEAALSVCFRGGQPDPTTELTDVQRQLLETLVKNQSFWSLGNALLVLQNSNLPSTRREMADFLGIDYDVDESLKLLQSARFDRRIGNIDKAIEQYFQAIRLAPSKEKIILETAEMLIEAGDFYSAVSLYKQVINGKTRNMDEMDKMDKMDERITGKDLINFGFALSNLDRYEEALDAFEQAESLFDDPYISLRNQQITLQKLNRHDEALALLERMYNKRNDFEALYHRGLAYVKAGRYEQSVYFTQKALEIHPEDALAHYTIACAYSLSESTDKALYHIEKALLSKPDLRDDIASDADFEPIKNNPKFRELVKKPKG